MDKTTLKLCCLGDILERIEFKFVEDSTYNPNGLDVVLLYGFESVGKVFLSESGGIELYKFLKDKYEGENQ